MKLPPKRYIDPRNLHSRLDHTLFKLMSAGRAEPHGDHPIAYHALQVMGAITWRLVQGLQLALAHAAEPHFLVAEVTGNQPIRPGEP